MNMIRRLFTKLFGGAQNDAPYDDNNSLYEVDLFDAYGYNYKTVGILAEDDIQAQADALDIYGGTFAIAELIEA